jgi:hypothetical protein
LDYSVGRREITVRVDDGVLETIIRDIRYAAPRTVFAAAYSVRVARGATWNTAIQDRLPVFLLILT